MRIKFLDRLCNSRIRRVVDDICPPATRQVPVKMNGGEQRILLLPYFQLNSLYNSSVNASSQIIARALPVIKN